MLRSLRRSCEHALLALRQSDPRVAKRAFKMDGISVVDAGKTLVLSLPVKMMTPAFTTLLAKMATSVHVSFSLKWLDMVVSNWIEAGGSNRMHAEQTTFCDQLAPRVPELLADRVRDAQR